MGTKTELNNWVNQNPHLSLAFLLFVLPESATTSQIPWPHSSFPAAQVSFNTSWLCPAPSIWLYCGLGMPGMSTGTPVLFIHKHTQQCTYVPGLVLMVFHSKACPTSGPGTNTSRRGQIGFNQTSATAPIPAVSRWCLQVTVWDFISGHPTPELTQRPLFCVLWHWGIMLPVWNIQTEPVLMKRHILLCSHLFLLRKCWSGPAMGQKTDPVCGCWETVSGRESRVSKRDRLLPDAYF